MNHSNFESCKLPLGCSHHTTESAEAEKPQLHGPLLRLPVQSVMGFLLFRPKAAELS